MKEDLNMYGNQMTYQLSCYMAGFIVGQIPLTMLATKLPINLYLPIMDSLWALFTLGMFKITNYHHLYTKSEITKRSALFFCASQIGSMSGEYIQAAAYNSLNRIGGIAGWKWLYLLAFIIIIPISLYGIFTLPGLPCAKNSKPFKLLSKKEYRLAGLRMLREGRSSGDKMSIRSIKQTIFGSWRFSVLVMYAIFFSQADGPSSNNGLPI